MAKTKSYNLFVIVAFIALCYPMIMGWIKKDNKPNLTGIVINDVNPDSLLKKDKSMWFSGEYQNLKDDYNNDHWAFKENFVRLNNQFYYQQPYPKSLANEFGTDVLLPIIQSFNIHTEDALHTYVQHIIQQLRNAIVYANNGVIYNTPQQMLVTGGGALNKYLIQQLQKECDPLHINITVTDSHTVQYKEALIMALLGVLRWREENTTLASVTGATRSSIGGAVWIGQEA